MAGLVAGALPMTTTGGDSLKQLSRSAARVDKRQNRTRIEAGWTIVVGVAASQPHTLHVSGLLVARASREGLLAAGL